MKATPDIEFTVPGPAAPQGSKVVSRWGGVHEQSKRTGPWRERVALRAHEVMDGSPLIDEAVLVDATFLFVRGSGHWTSKGNLSAEGRRRPYPLHQGDLDKLCRALGDALTDTVLTDDKLIVGINARKAYQPGRTDGALTVVRIWQLLPKADDA